MEIESEDYNPRSEKKGKNNVIKGINIFDFWMDLLHQTREKDEEVERTRIDK